VGLNGTALAVAVFAFEENESIRRPSLLGWRPSLIISCKKLVMAKGITTRSDRTLLVAPGIATRNKEATRLEASAIRSNVRY